MMKRRFSSFLSACTAAIMLCFVLAGCSSTSRSDRISYVPDTQDTTDFSSVVTVVTTPSPTPSADAAQNTSAASPAPAATSAAPVVSSAPAAMVTSAPTATPTATPIVVATPIPTVYVNTTDVTITKSPTSETVEEYGSASFVAYATNYSTINWILVSPDSSEAYNVTEGPVLFDGLGVKGQNSTTLVLENIPYSMNGWRVQAYFTNTAGTRYYTNGAYLTVTQTYNPGSENEAKAYQLAIKCYNELTSIAARNSYAYGTGVENYSYYSDAGDFNVTLSNGTYIIIGEFRSYPATDAYNPIYALVYDSSYNLKAEYPTAFFREDTGMSDFESILKTPENAVH